MTSFDRVPKPFGCDNSFRLLKMRARCDWVCLCTTDFFETRLLTAIFQGICLSNRRLIPTAVITTSASFTSLQRASQFFSARVNNSATADGVSLASTIYALIPGRALVSSESFTRLEGNGVSPGDSDLEDSFEDIRCTDAGRLKGMLGAYNLR